MPCFEVTEVAVAGAGGVEQHCVGYGAQIGEADDVPEAEGDDVAAKLRDTIRELKTKEFLFT